MATDLHSSAVRAARIGFSALLAVALQAGCAFDEGTPWATWDADLRASLDTQSRGDMAAFVTSDDFELSITSMSVGVDDVALEFAAGASDVSFDPASPPAGFGLCHNGHCHADDGALVPYDEIRASLSGGGSESVWFTRGASVVVPLNETAVSIPLADCEEAQAECWLPRGQATRVRVRVDTLSVIGVVRDLRTSAPRLSEATAFEITVPAAELDLTSALNQRIGGRAAPAIHTQVSLTLPASVFDGMPWGTPELAARLVENLSEADSLRVSLERADF